MLFWIFVIALGVFLGGLALRHWQLVLGVIWMGVLLVLALVFALVGYAWLVPHRG